MVLSDISVKRPVFAAVISLLLVAFGIVGYQQLPLRQYPNIDPPIVSVQTNYPGASAAVVETRITEVLEDRVSGVSGIRTISSSSQDGRSSITLEFSADQNIDAAANDIRDRVSTALGDLPVDADPPEISKVEADSDVIMWMNLASSEMNLLDLTDFANRVLVDRFSVLPGVARVRVGGGLEYAMRVWLDRQAMAARRVTVTDIEQALRAENVELPAGRVESQDRVFVARLKRGYQSVDDFNNLVVYRGSDGHLVRLSEVARVERGAVDDRLMFRGNGVPMVGIGVVKQSTANTIEVAGAAQKLADKINPTLPPGMSIEQSYDSSVFIRAAIDEVWKTLAIAVCLVIAVIYLFLGSVRATLVPALTVPVSITATFIALYAFGFSINLLTLLALVLAVGLVVDDSIVVLENIHRRVEEGESPLLASFMGARQVGFAVVATSIVLVAVFVPITFLSGDIGRLFTEFALTMAAAVGFSSLVALTLSPMLCSKLLKKNERPNPIVRAVDRGFEALQNLYLKSLGWLLSHAVLVMAVFVALVGANYWLFNQVPSEYAPREDRGAFFLIVSGPEGATYSYMEENMTEIERRMMPLVESGEIQRLLVRAPSFFNAERYNAGIVICVLSPWDQRRSAFEIMREVGGLVADMPGVRAFPVMRQGLGGRTQKPVQFVLGGGTYEELEEWRDRLDTAMAEDNPGLQGVDWDYKDTQPQLRLEINRDRAADQGVSTTDIGLTLQTMLGSRRVTTYVDNGEEYDVILEGERGQFSRGADLDNVYLRPQRGEQLVPLANLIDIREQADANQLNRYNRTRAFTLEANLDDGLTLGEALNYLDAKAREVLPATAIIDYKGQSQNLRDSSSSIVFVLLLGVIVVFLVLAAQFESWVHPLIIMLTVPLATSGALLGLWLFDSSLNIYSQIGLIMLVGLAAKNGILIVEFANQLRDQGRAFDDALMEAAKVRLRPILMTGITTAAGALPLIFSSGAGAETRFTIGIVILFGVSAATFFTLAIVPAAYSLLARKTKSPEFVTRELENQLKTVPE